MIRFTFDFPNAAGVSQRRVFTNPTEIITAHDLTEVVPALQRVADASASGSWCAGYVSYEAAPAFEPKMQVRSGERMPLLLFGVFQHEAVSPAEGVQRKPSTDAAGPASWAEMTSPAEFRRAIARIHEAIADGETYQVNYTTRLTAAFDGDATQWYEQLRSAQGSGWHGMLETDEHVILSASPELFFERRGALLRTRPMKGTRARGRWREEDNALRAQLETSLKDRAENLMIVDLLRNDVGRISETASVRVPALFETEKYRTVWQMTSRVEGTLREGTTLVDIFRALFPCGSVTGAPKINTMKWIASLEDAPREVYCGAIGIVEPGGDCVFSVPIRTVWIDRASGAATYGTGAGITADSVADDELDELRSKAAVLRMTGTSVTLLETMRAENGEVLRLDRHMKRLAESAEYFDNKADVASAMQQVHGFLERAPGAYRIRLLVGDRGEIISEANEAPPRYAEPDASRDAGDLAAVALALHPVSSADAFLYHKTTNRGVYDNARLAGFFDTLLWNEREEVTEFTNGNVVVEIDGARFTPSRSCGLLAGVFRAQLLEEDAVIERVIARDELRHCSRMWLINSVREWVEVKLADAPAG